MIVVSNSSPIISLAAIDKLELFRQLYGKILIPEAVFREAVMCDEDKAGATEIQKKGWIEVKSVTESPLLDVLKLDLDDGEAEAIALAIEIKADLLLMDERKGRNIAGRLGVQHIGVLAVLVAVWA